MKRLLTVLCFLLLWAAASAAAAEVSVSLTPENPRVGDYVDVRVTADRDNPQDVAYALYFGEEQTKVYAGKGVQRYTVSFRPRQEGAYTLLVTVTYGKNDRETAEITVPVSGEAPAREGPDVLYSQKDGWWKKKKYSSTELQTSGCAIFAMSHALQRMGLTGEEVTPERLAKTHVYYREGEGTWNEGLVRYAAADFDFTTQKELITSPNEVAACLRRGDFFSFSIVDRHIALADGISEDGTKVHIVDSAPGATFERIRFEGKIFFQNEDGSFTAAATADDLPGIRWFFETNEFGGMEYWMDLEYCASRGMRLIRMPWLKADLGDGLKSVTVEYAGAAVTKVKRDKESVRVATKDLQISLNGGGAPSVALVTAKKGTSLTDAEGKKIAGKKTVPRQNMVLVLAEGEDSVYVWWDDAFGYLSKEDLTVLPAEEGKLRTGLIAMNGYANGGSQVTVHLSADKKSTGLALWKTGTPIAAIEQQDSWWLVEGKGLRGWVHEKYILWDEAEDPEEPAAGQTENPPEEKE